MATPKKAPGTLEKVGKKPLEFTKEMLEHVERMSMNGLDNRHIAACLGISESTFYQKFHKVPEFKAAVEEGRARGISEIACALYKNAIGGNVPAQIFFLKSRAKWSETQDITIATKKPIKVKNTIVTDPLQAAKMYAEFIKSG